jgi:hypothetical protein
MRHTYSNGNIAEAFRLCLKIVEVGYYHCYNIRRHRWSCVESIPNPICHIVAADKNTESDAAISLTFSCILNIAYIGREAIMSALDIAWYFVL